MASLRRLAWMCRKLAKQHMDEPGVPAAPEGTGRYTEWVQVALILYHVELEKSLRETEDYLNEMPGVLAVFELDRAPPIVRSIGGSKRVECVNSAACSPSPDIRERHHRRHRTNRAKYHSCDPSATAVRDSYCIF